MKRTELRNKFLKHKTDESRHAFVKQRNYCLSSKEVEKELWQQSSCEKH